jgi:hypothetical protein
MNMFVICFPFSGAKDQSGEYARMEYLFFRDEAPALKCLREQDHKDGHEYYEVPCFHRGGYVRREKILWAWEPQDMVQAEDYANHYGLKLIEFDRSWLE